MIEAQILQVPGADGPRLFSVVWYRTDDATRNEHVSVVGYAPTARAAHKLRRKLAPVTADRQGTTGVLCRSCGLSLIPGERHTPERGYCRSTRRANARQ